MPREEGDEMSFDAEGRLRWGRQAAGLLIRRVDTGQFLLLLRSQEVMDPGLFGIPGGRAEEGEGLEEAAISESQEELGALPPLAFVARDTYHSGDFAYTTFLVHVGGRAAKRWAPELNWENDAWAWMSVDEAVALDNIHPNVRRVIEKWA